MPKLTIDAEINGRKISRETQPHSRLLDFLREDLNLTGTKEGCGAGECGTCSVFVDGKLVKSCLMPAAKAKGTKIETIEGLAAPGDLTPVQKAFHKTGASQCGYCIPGMVMAATSALRENPAADIEEIKERLGGNICRCTGYTKIFEAVEIARDVIAGDMPATALDEDKVGESYIGTNVRRLDAPSKVSGRLKYAADMKMYDMLQMQVLRSPHAHAKVLSIDTSEVEAMEGCRMRHHRRRCAGQRRIWCLRARPADHGARQGSACRRSRCRRGCRRSSDRAACRSEDQGGVRRTPGPL